MSDNPRAMAWLRDFGAYWRDRVRAGVSSDFDRLEWCAAWIFAQWLSQEMAKKDAEGHDG